MSAKPLAQCLVDDLENVLKKYRDQGVSYAETIGVIEILKNDVLFEMYSKKEED